MTLTHPAKFSDEHLNTIREMLDDLAWEGIALDPFAGVGRIHELMTPYRRTFGIELEEEWARLDEATMLGDATCLPFRTASFDAVITSPPYGNRMADNYAGDPSGTRRFTYRIGLGRPLTPGSAAGMQWGQSYRQVMHKALIEIERVLKSGGLFVLNVADHIRGGEIMRAVEWYLDEVDHLGFVQEREAQIDTTARVPGANWKDRCPEKILLLRKS